MSLALTYSFSMQYWTTTNSESRIYLLKSFPDFFSNFIKGFKFSLQEFSTFLSTFNSDVTFFGPSYSIFSINSLSQSSNIFLVHKYTSLHFSSWDLFFNVCSNFFVDLLCFKAVSHATKRASFFGPSEGLTSYLKSWRTKSRVWWPITISFVHRGRLSDIGFSS